VIQRKRGISHWEAMEIALEIQDIVSLFLQSLVSSLNYAKVWKTICNRDFHHSCIKDFGCVHDCNCSHINCIYPQFPAISRNMTKLWPRFLHCSGILTDLGQADFEQHSCFVWRGKHFNNSPNLNIQTREGNLLMNFHTLPWYHFLPFLFCIFPLPTPKYPHELTWENPTTPPLLLKTQDITYSISNISVRNSIKYYKQWRNYSTFHQLKHNTKNTKRNRGRKKRTHNNSREKSLVDG